MKKAILWTVPALSAVALGGCANNPLPSANSVQARFDPSGRTVQLMVSEQDPTTQAELVGANGAPVQAGSVTLVSEPHSYYDNSACTFGSTGVQAALPPGGTPTCVSDQSDQYVASVSIPAPADYTQRWTEYRVRLQVGDRWMAVAAPPPAPG
ncbi:hypothetical protein [Rhodopila globiformis]|jgi:hypothetical protein|uniref:Uncharacterized protein n=1 Tax=Rhodopila globiformis TaxID=1071 RepID=A0A2S6N3E4_RHOGL|nr:hypothetical protein [Rhodopila globiformis]PPQ29133.1 hypothetical protein CCS01_22315 [Rhodopila globiformis]